MSVYGIGHGSRLMTDRGNITISELVQMAGFHSGIAMIPDGCYKVKDRKCNIFVYDRHGEKRKVDGFAFQQKNARVFDVIFHQDKIIRGAPDAQILSKDSEWIDLSEFYSGADYCSERCKTVRYVSIEDNPSILPMVNIILNSGDSFRLSSGFYIRSFPGTYK